MQVIGLVRFSYLGEGGFQVEHATLAERMAYLYAPHRMETRFAQFETMALPAFRAQTDPDFTLVVVTGESLPACWRDRLEALLSDMPQATLRFDPPGPHRKVMQAAINAARHDMNAPCLQFRHDDDDAVAVDFVERLRTLAGRHSDVVAGNRLVAFDFDQGYAAQPGPAGLAAAPIRLTLYGVALAMAVRGGVRQSIMNFAHKKLGNFMPVITASEPRMFVRGYNAFNDSRQKDGVAPIDLPPIDAELAETFRRRFAIDEAAVRQAFAGLSAQPAAPGKG